MGRALGQSGRQTGIQVHAPQWLTFVNVSAGQHSFIYLGCVCVCPGRVEAMVGLARSFQWAFVVTAALVDIVGIVALQDMSVDMHLCCRALLPDVCAMSQSIVIFV